MRATSCSLAACLAALARNGTIAQERHRCCTARCFGCTLSGYLSPCARCIAISRGDPKILRCDDVMGPVYKQMRQLEGDIPGLVNCSSSSNLEIVDSVLHSIGLLPPAPSSTSGESLVRCSRCLSVCLPATSMSSLYPLCKIAPLHPRVVAIQHESLHLAARASNGYPTVTLRIPF
jgi:hypothetical protein